MKWKKMKEEIDSNPSGGFSNWFSLQNDQDSAIIRFIGGDDEPYLYRRHYNAGKGFIVCSSGIYEGCVPCYLSESTAGIGKSSFQAAFSLIDYRKYHKVEKSGKNSYVECSGRSCELCKNNDPILSGRKYWSVGQTIADQLFVLNAELSNNCKGCYSGQLRVVEYECPKCSAILDYDERDPDTIKCFECKELIEPVEIIECDNCKKPERSSLSDWDIKITRCGAAGDQKTNYMFFQSRFGPVKEEFKEFVDPLDLKKILSPLTPDAQASSLGVANPFLGSGKAMPVPEKYQEYNDQTTDPFE